MGSIWDMNGKLAALSAKSGEANNKKIVKLTALTAKLKQATNKPEINPEESENERDT